MFFGLQTTRNALIPGISGIHHNIPAVQAFAHNSMLGLFHCKTITYITESGVGIRTADIFGPEYTDYSRILSLLTDSIWGITPTIGKPRASSMSSTLRNDLSRTSVRSVAAPPITSPSRKPKTAILLR